MAEYKLKLQKRELTGKKLKSLRNDGMIPSVVYGGKEPILTASSYVETEKVLAKAGHHSPIDLDIDGKKRIAIIKNVAFDPVSRKLMNIEFLAVSAKETVEAKTPIVIVNFEESEASKTYHFALSHLIEEIDVKAKPADLPKELTIDASKLANLDDKLTLAEIKLPEGVEYADKEINLEQIVASLYDPAAEAEKREAEEKAEAEAEAEEAGEEKAETENEAEASAEADSEEKEA
ncbi:50S ribosomal protein L25 [Candidatus Saccharibacteria bacterium]|nr:50S ribosomal protein L25 [Candidatus Saccharibacteria bacterium]